MGAIGRSESNQLLPQSVSEDLLIDFLDADMMKSTAERILLSESNKKDK
jgi:hypothetical protein